MPASSRSKVRRGSIRDCSAVSSASGVFPARYFHLAMASAEGAPAEGTLYSRCVADAEHTLGGIRDDTEPAHPSVIMHLGATSCLGLCVVPPRPALISLASHALRRSPPNFRRCSEEPRAGAGLDARHDPAVLPRASLPARAHVRPAHAPGAPPRRLAADRPARAHARHHEVVPVRLALQDRRRPEAAQPHCRRDLRVLLAARRRLALAVLCRAGASLRGCRSGCRRARPQPRPLRPRRCSTGRPSRRSTSRTARTTWSRTRTCGPSRSSTRHSPSRRS